jgi:hypothetical protein
MATGGFIPIDLTSTAAAHKFQKHHEGENPLMVGIALFPIFTSGCTRVQLIGDHLEGVSATCIDLFRSVWWPPIVEYQPEPVS